METAETKICSTCGRELPVDKFKRITRKRGNIYIYNLCRDCYNAKLREEYAKLSPEDKRKELDRRNKYYDSVYPKDAKRVVSKYRPYTLERGKRGACKYAGQTKW